MQIYSQLELVRDLRVTRKKGTHYNFHGHTIETCYKLHGYPPGYKSKSKAVSQSLVSVNQATTNAPTNSGGPLGDFFQKLSTDQYQQFMSALSKQMAAFSVTFEQSASTSSSGTCFSISLDNSLSSPYY